MAMRRLRVHREAADLDMTPFISLLVALVPFLLVSIVFSHITVLDLKLPDAASGGSGADNQNEEVELVIRADHLEIDFPRGVVLKTIADTPQGTHDYAMLSTVLQEVKRQLKEKAIANNTPEKKSITILSEANTPYQTIITAMDTVRSFKAVVAVSVVDAELFPDIAFGDAPAAAGAVANSAASTGATR